MKTRSFVARSLGLALLALHAQAQNQTEVAPAVGAAARAELGSPALLDRVLERPAAGRVLRLLEGASIRLQAQQASSSGELAPGFAFDVAKPIGTTETPESEAFDLRARGNVALDGAKNPDDFTEVFLRARWFGSTTLGDGAKSRAELAKELADPTAEELAALASSFSPSEHGSKPGSSDLQRRTTHTPTDGDVALLGHRWADQAARSLPNELVWDWELHAGLETTQNLASRQMVFGFSTSMRPIGWNDDSALAAWNVFDAPAAALRWLTGGDFAPSGRAWPTLIAGLDVVDASASDLRDAVTDDESYLRLNLEAAYRTHAFTLGDHACDLTAHYRFHQELDAPAGIRQADLDASSHLELHLELPHHFDLGYSTGRLPLDDHDDSTFSISYHLTF